MCKDCQLIEESLKEEGKVEGGLTVIGLKKLLNQYPDDMPVYAGTVDAYPIMGTPSTFIVLDDGSCDPNVGREVLGITSV